MLVLRYGLFPVFRTSLRVNQIRVALSLLISFYFWDTIYHLLSALVHWFSEDILWASFTFGISHTFIISSESSIILWGWVRAFPDHFNGAHPKSLQILAISIPNHGTSLLSTALIFCLLFLKKDKATQVYSDLK